MLAEDVAAPISEARERARKVLPRYSEGPLVRVATARHQAEAELLANLLLEEGIPSLIRRTGGFDVPDFLASGPREILVPASGAELARELLQPERMTADGRRHAGVGEGRRAGPGRRDARDHPRRGHRRRHLVTRRMWLPGGVVLAVGIASFMRAPLLPEIGRDLSIGAADLAFLTTAFAVGRLVMDLPAGRLADRLPPARALAGTGLGVAISAALIGSADALACRARRACSSSAWRRRSPTRRA